MLGAVLMTLFLVVYAYGLGATSVLVWRYCRTWMRWVPGSLTALYYLLSFLFPHPGVQALVNRDDYPLVDALRGGCSTLALATGLYLLTLVVREQRSGGVQ